MRDKLLASESNDFKVDFKVELLWQSKCCGLVVMISKHHALTLMNTVHSGTQTLNSLSFTHTHTHTHTPAHTLTNSNQGSKELASTHMHSFTKVTNIKKVRERKSLREREREREMCVRERERDVCVRERDV